MIDGLIGNNNVMPIHIYSVYKDGIDDLAFLERLRILSADDPFIEIINTTNFNKTKLNNHNMYICNLKYPHAIVYDRDKWITIDFTSLIIGLITAKKLDLEEMLDETKKFLYPVDIKQIINKLNKIDIFNDKFRKIIHASIKYMLYVNRPMVINTKRLHKEQIQNTISNNNFNGLKLFRWELQNNKDEKLMD